jgi:hypothetical protein
MLDESLGTTETRGAGDELEPRGHAHRLGTSSPHLQRQHAAEARHLTRGHRVPRMRGQPRVVDPGDAGVGREEASDRLGVLAVAPHPVRQRPDSAEHEPAVKRRGHGTAGDLHRPDPLKQLVVGPRDHRAAQHVAVTAEVLGRRVHDEVGAQLERPGQHRRGPGVVAGHAGTRLPRQGDDRRNVRHAHERVRRRLDPDEARGRADRGRDRGRVSHVDRGVLQTPPGVDLGQELAGDVVRVVGHDDVIARGEGLEDGGRGRHAGGEGGRRGPCLELGETALERPPIGVRIPGVDVTARKAAVRRPLERRGQMDRRNDRAGGRVRLVAGMYGQRLEAHR